MGLSVAVVGSGRMGSFVGKQLPKEVRKIFIDIDEAKAKELAQALGGEYAISAEGAKDADVIAVVLPAKAVNDTVKEIAKVAREGAIILNMATSGTVEDDVKKKHLSLHFVDAKIIGSAKVMAMGFPSCVVLGTKDSDILEKARYLLPGYTKVTMGDAALVPKINTIGSTEGILAALEVRRKLKELNLPKEWEDVAIYTVCAGTMIAYVDNDLGEFGRKIVQENTDRE